MDADVIRLFEKLENLIERRFGEVRDGQEKLEGRMGNLEVIGAAQGEQLKYHIKRTDLAEERQEMYRKEAAQATETVRVEAKQGDAAIYTKIEETRKAMSEAIEPLKTHQAASKLSGRWLIGGITFILTVAGTAAAWLALK